MKVFNTKQKDVFVRYDSMREFDNALTSETIDGRGYQSHNGDQDFTGTSSFDESEKLRKYGDFESHKMLQTFKSKTDTFIKDATGKRTRNFNDVMGYQPIVPNAIIGLPKAMINQRREVKKDKIVTLLWICDHPWHVSKDDIALKGAYTLSLIESLERNGYRVKVYAGSASKVRSQQGFFINLKRADRPLNTVKLAYYLVNPSFLRRTSFRISESEAALPDSTHDGYGRVSDREHVREILTSFIGKSIIIDSSVDISTGNSSKDNLNALQERVSGCVE